MNQTGDGEKVDENRAEELHKKLGPPDDRERIAGVHWAWYMHRAAFRQAGTEVLFPLCVLVAVGLAIFWFDGAGNWRFVGEACITGALVTGGFAWISAFNSVVESDRGRQLDLGSASALNYADLAGLELGGMYLRHADLTGARLSGVKGRCIDMHGARLVDARLTNAQLPGGDFTNAVMTGAGCYQANFNKADLRDANLEGARLGKANLSWAKLQGADLRGADLRDTDLTGATLDGAELAGAWYSPRTKFPEGFNERGRGMICRSSSEGADELRCDCSTRTESSPEGEYINLTESDHSLEERPTPEDDES